MGEKKKSRFKLSELATAAGVAGNTIHFYVRSGILPPAQKIREKLALYDETHLRLLRLVQKLQKERRLPLGFIGRLFKQADYDAEALELNLVAGMYDRMVEGKGFFPQAAKERSAAISPVPEITIEPDFQKDLFDLQLIGNAQGPLTGEERRIAWTVKSALEKGVPLKFFGELLAPIGTIVSRQTSALLSAINGDTGFRDVVHQAGEIDWLINHFIEAAKTRQLRLHFEKSFEQGPLSVRRLRERIYVPSAAFLEKHRIPEQIEDLETKVTKERKDHALRLFLAEAYLAVGRYEEAASEAKKILKYDRNQADALISQATADGLLGRTDESVRAAEQAYKLRPDDARTVAYCAMAYLIQAAQVGGVISPAQWLKKSLNLFQKSLSLPPKRAKDKLEMLFMKGRAYTILPAPLEKVDEGISALHDLLAEVDRHNEQELGLPFTGFNEIYRVNTYCFLGGAHQIKGETQKAQEAWQQVLLRDPESNFGKRAFQQIEVKA